MKLNTVVVVVNNVSMSQCKDVTM